MYISDSRDLLTLQVKEFTEIISCHSEDFNAINPSSKRFALRWLKLAKTDKTRQKRIDHLFEISLKGVKLKGS